METARVEFPERPFRSVQNCEALAERVAEAVVRRRLELPATLFLEIHLPVTTLLHTTTLIAEPLLSPLFGADRIGTFAQLLAERKNVELLIRRIGELAALRDRREQAAG